MGIRDWFGRRRQPARAEAEHAEASRLWLDFPCRLGDVIVRTSGDEAWLAGAWLLCEHVPVASLFVAPDRGIDRMILAWPLPEARLAWLDGLELAPWPIAEPPAVLEAGARRFERTRRRPLTVRAFGDAPPSPAGILFAEYKEPGGGVLVTVSAMGLCRAWSGTYLAPGDYDVLPAPQS